MFLAKRNFFKIMLKLRERIIEKKKLEREKAEKKGVKGKNEEEEKILNRRGE